MEFGKFERTMRHEHDCGYTYKIHYLEVDGEKIEIVESTKDYSLGIRSSKFTSEEQDEIFEEVHKRL